MNILGPFDDKLKKLFYNNENLRGMRLPEVKNYQTLEARYRKKIN